MSDVRADFEDLFAHRLSDEQMREFLLTLCLDETLSTSTIAVAADVMRSHAIRLPISEELRSRSIDIVGTGGDKIGSFNISSSVSLLCASCGSSVAKHGSRSVTSKSGSADMFESLGVRLDLSIDQSAKMLEECGFTFMFVQNHHPAMSFIMPVRRSIPDKTIFNILGPLTNPAGVKKSLLGVFHSSFVPKIAEALKINGYTSAMVVSSREGMDEVSLSSSTTIAHLSDGTIKTMQISPSEYGFKSAPLSAIVGGDAKQNAKILYDIFDSKASDAQRDIVLLNSAFALVVDGRARDAKDGVEMAREAIESKRALAKLKQIIEVSNKL